MGVYKWKEGARFSADVSKVAEELESLDERTAENALQLAEDESTELHKCATWDDSKAAHMFRLDEMRRVIRCIVVVDEADDREPITYRAFEYVTIESEQEDEKPRRAFMPTAEALTNEGYRKQVLADIKASIGELSQKAKVYRYLAEYELDTAQHHLDLAREAVTV